MPEIGATLREARMRAHIDVSEIEAQTKIRAKYLRALENEEWSLLPGPVFVKSFLRTYAQALELDGKALVEEYRLHHERPSEGVLEPIVTTGPQQRGRSRSQPARASRFYLSAVAVTAGVVLLLVVLLLTDGGSSPKKPKTAAVHTQTTAKKVPHHHHAPGTGAAANEVTLSLHPSSAVFVCLIGDKGRKLIDNEELQAEQNTQTFRAHRFEVTLGDSSVTMVIDGHERTVEESSEPIGYSITKARGRHLLSSTQRPTCK
jgi:cytoskeleton protein RodZ